MRHSDYLFDAANRPTVCLQNLLADLEITATNLAELNTVLQKRYVQKNADGTAVERWKQPEVESPAEGRVKYGLTGCGFIHRCNPSESRYDRAGLPGALAVRAGARLLDLVDAWKAGVRWKETVIFTGARPLEPEKETFSACCIAIALEDFAAAEPSFATVTTEAEMLEWMWDNVNMPADLRETPVEIIDSCMKPPTKEGGPMIRPSTEDPLDLWLTTNPTPGSMLISSGNPYGPGQTETFYRIAGPKGYTFECFGHEAPDTLKLGALLGEFARYVYSVAKTRGVA